jgi:hypothetical protein
MKGQPSYELILGSESTSCKGLERVCGVRPCECYKPSTTPLKDYLRMSFQLHTLEYNVARHRLERREIVTSG